MSSVINKGLCWALAALQVAADDINVERTDKHHDTPLKADDSQVKAVSPPEVLGDENALPRFSREQVANHSHGDSCWFVINNRVYDVTRFLEIHPGGDDIILEYGGHDATASFIEKGHSKDAIDMLEEYYIGELIEEDWLPQLDFT